MLGCRLCPCEQVVAWGWWCLMVPRVGPWVFPSSRLTRNTTGVSLAETQDLEAAKCCSAHSHARKVIRVLYAGGDDELFDAV